MQNNPTRHPSNTPFAVLWRRWFAVPQHCGRSSRLFRDRRRKPQRHCKQKRAPVDVDSGCRACARPTKLRATLLNPEPRHLVSIIDVMWCCFELCFLDCKFLRSTRLVFWLLLYCTKLQRKEGHFRTALWTMRRKRPMPWSTVVWRTHLHPTVPLLARLHRAARRGCPGTCRCAASLAASVRLAVAARTLSTTPRGCPEDPRAKAQQARHPDGTTAPSLRMPQSKATEIR